MWSGVRENIEDLLRSRADHLETPYQVARLAVTNTMFLHQLDGYYPDLPDQWDFLLQTLSRSEIDRAEGLSLLEQLQSYDEGAETPLDDANRYVVAVLFTDFDTPSEYQSPVSLFGVPFEYSPTRLYILYHTRPKVSDWLKVKDQLAGLEEEQQLATIRQYADVDGSCLQWIATKPYDYELRPLWRAAAVMTASRLYRIEHDSWPSQSSDLGSFLWFEPKVSLTPVTDGLQIQDLSSNQSWVLK